MKKLIEFDVRIWSYIFLPKNKNYFPLKMYSSEMPVGINYKAGVSAQLKECCDFSRFEFLR